MECWREHGPTSLAMVRVRAACPVPLVFGGVFFQDVVFCFIYSCFFRLFASFAFPVLLWRVFWLLRLFTGLSAFGGFGFSHPLLSQFLSRLFGFCTLSWVFWLWLAASSASPVPLWCLIFVFMYACTSSNIIGKPPPQPPRCFLCSIAPFLNRCTPN